MDYGIIIERFHVTSSSRHKRNIFFKSPDSSHFGAQTTIGMYGRMLTIRLNPRVCRAVAYWTYSVFRGSRDDTND